VIGAAASDLSAPGKLLLAGEYAVLGGATAVVMAVDRRARAHRGVRQPSPFLDAVTAQLTTRLGPEHPSVRAMAEVTIDTSAFSSGGRKLGLGSSAAATVAATAWALRAGGRATDREEILEISSAAHGDAQGRRGTRGSGADVAASTYGGILAYAIRGEQLVHEPLPSPTSVVLLPFFTGHSADTVTMVARVQAAGRAAEPSLHAIADAAEMLIAGLRRDHGPTILAALAAGGEAIAKLGQTASYDLETAAVRAVRTAVAPWGGAVKTTGAGGGDLAIAAVPLAETSHQVRAAIIQAGCQVVPLAIDLRGVDLSQATL
jgi:phosphomevalonate kinase